MTKSLKSGNVTQVFLSAAFTGVFLFYKWHRQRRLCFITVTMMFRWWFSVPITKQNTTCSSLFLVFQESELSQFLHTIVVSNEVFI